jgi:opacity protein-like surface antigen
MNQLTVEGQVAIPVHSTRITPFALGGIGAVKFAPTDFTKGIIPDAQSQNKFASVFGGGADIGIGRGIGFRAEYRVLLTHSPTFELPEIGETSRLIVHEPVMGLFWRF